MKEHPDYRSEIESIAAATGKRLLTVTDVAAYLGRSRKWCREHYSFDPKTHSIPATTLAREMHK